MGTPLKKQYLELEGVPILARTIQAFSSCDRIDQIVLVIPETDRQYCQTHILSELEIQTPIHLVSGGEERYDSVRNGLLKVVSLSGNVNKTMVLIHDGVRPFVEHSLIDNCLEKAGEQGACIPCIPMTDTIKQVDTEGVIKKTLDRNVLVCAQTPQVFKLSILEKAFKHAEKTGFSGTDDASYVEHSGSPVVITQGSPFNIKITTPDDLVIARHFLNQGLNRL